ncbi:putative protein kinase RLK-Pelle-CR4L family transcription factor bHLH family [Helianthus debilis subsp. tardiflorus]
MDDNSWDKTQLPASSKNLISERKRRKKLNDQLFALRAAVPNISKMDKASIIKDAIDYIQTLQDQEQRIQNEVNELNKIYHDAILSTTNNFSHKNLIAEGALGKVYKGQLKRIKVAIHRLDCKHGQGDELEAEISMIKSLEHKNVTSILGYSDENNEKIIIYKAFHGTLNQHLRNQTLTWAQRLQICLGVARGLNYIHYDVIYCDINSSKIILEENWEPKIYGFELSTKYPQSWRHRLLFSRYFDTNNLTPKYDVYCFGVLLLEVLCGRKPSDYKRWCSRRTISDH